MQAIRKHQSTAVKTTISAAIITTWRPHTYLYIYPSQGPKSCYEGTIFGTIKMWKVLWLLVKISRKL